MDDASLNTVLGAVARQAHGRVVQSGAAKRQRQLVGSGHDVERDVRAGASKMADNPDHAGVMLRDNVNPDPTDGGESPGVSGRRHRAVALKREHIAADCGRNRSLCRSGRGVKRTKKENT